MGTRTALVVTGTRADYGLWVPILEEARRRGTELDVRLLVTAMHLDPRFGSTVEEVRRDGFPISAEIPSTATGDSRGEMVQSLATAMNGMLFPVRDTRPTWLLLLGDRGEQLAGALVALHLGIPVAHLHGGERTLGAVDDAVRDMITRIAHLHLVANSEAARRVAALGEEPWRVVITGAPGLDSIADRDASGDGRVLQRYGVKRGRYLLLMVHPETVGERDPLAMLAATISGAERIGLPIIAIGSNSDAGGRSMLSALAEQRARFVGVWASVPHHEYLALLAGAAALVGNSSSGLIEAPALGIPVVNVGDRQRGRVRGDNVVDVAPDPDAIAQAVGQAVGSAAREALSGRSPYGDGSAARRIVDALVSTPIDDRFMRKEVAP